MSAFTIRTDRIKENAIQAIRELPIDPVYSVIIRPYKKNRTAAQNALMWMWHTAYVDHFGVDGGKLEQHISFKLTHVLPIILRDEDPDGVMQRIYDNCRADKDMLHKFGEMLSTTDLNTKQLKEALDSYDLETAFNGLVFPHPDDFYHEAMA